MKRKYEEQEGLSEGGGKGRKPRKTTVRVSVNSALMSSNSALGHIGAKENMNVYGAGSSGVTGLQAGGTQYSIVHGTVTYPHQPSYHRTPMATWNPPVYNPSPHSTPLQQQQQQQHSHQQQQQHHQPQQNVWVATGIQQPHGGFKQEPVEQPQQHTPQHHHLSVEHNYNGNEHTPPHSHASGSHLTPSHHHSDDSDFSFMSPLK